MAAYSNYLASLRRLRGYIQVGNPAVTIVEDPTISIGFVAYLPDEGQEHVRALHDAQAHVYLILGPDTVVMSRALRVHEAIWLLARARSTRPSETLPMDLVTRARKAEESFVRAVHEDLARYSRLPSAS